MEIRKMSNPEKNRSFKNKHFNNLREYSLVGISYFFLTVILTYPVLFRIKTDIPGILGRFSPVDENLMVHKNSNTGSEFNCFNA